MTTLAFDRSERWKDQDGRLHVRVTNISKATVNPYRGREIPGYEVLGLEPDCIYQLLRDPAELAKGAATFNNLPLLSKHVAVSAADPKEQLVAGSTGTDARYEKPYLVNSLVIWRDEDISAVESKAKCELSCAYYYTPDMTSGTYEGLRYDGVMRDIRGNHVALVETGRAGPGVMVHDAKETRMPALTSRKALLVKGALHAALRPKLMTGTVLALDSALGAVNRLNWKTERPKVLAVVRDMAAGKLAKDATLDDLEATLIAMDAMEDGEEEDDDIDVEDEENGESEEKRKEREERDEREKAKDKARDSKAAKDRKGARDKARDADPDDKDDKAKDKAMDADTIRASIMAQMNAATEAREDVRPIVGKVSLALDSAEAIYGYALKARNVDTTGVHPSAFRALVKMLPATSAAHRPMAQDSAVGLETKFPALGRIRQA